MAQCSRFMSGGHVLKQVHKRRIRNILMVVVSQHFLGALAVQHAVIHTFDLIYNGAVVSKLLHILTESD